MPQLSLEESKDGSCHLCPAPLSPSLHTLGHLSQPVPDTEAGLSIFLPFLNRENPNWLNVLYPGTGPPLSVSEFQPTKNTGWSPT